MFVLIIKIVFRSFLVPIPGHLIIVRNIIIIPSTNSDIRLIGRFICLEILISASLLNALIVRTLLIAEPTIVQQKELHNCPSTFRGRCKIHFPRSLYIPRTTILCIVNITPLLFFWNTEQKEIIIVIGIRRSKKTHDRQANKACQYPDCSPFQ